MLKIKKIIVLCMFVMLSACNTTHHADNDHNKKVAAAEINIQLGMAYLDRHEIQRSKQKFLLALKEAPQLPEAWYSMAYYLEVTGDKEKAKQSYLKALALAPKRGDVNNNYGTFLCRHQEYSAAIKHFLIATRDDEYLDAAGAYENAGLCAELIPDRQLAMLYFERSLKQEHNRPSSLISLAQLNYEQGNYQAANDLLKQFLTVSPETKESRALRAQLAKVE